MRKCVNTSSFIKPVYKCQEAKRDVLPRNLFGMFYKKAVSFHLVKLVVEQTTISSVEKKIPTLKNKKIHQHR